ncbi:uncharacterized protein Dana_GF12831 [Drosophila ananassae]|uniref:Kazal-like domain-containing protein n=1 Tax=Drosophila ananassae TaxID=7217 RepID=B3MC90_DROAN|nr:uncharacterized protein LOC6495677 [Drosophila ananassae]EDV36190.1 uncharacterized protein Dana_GF12831 [Drosophila ananassae]
MKSVLRLATLLVILALACAYSSSSSSSSPKVCLLQDCNWSSTTNSCGKYGKSNLCTRFKNSCRMRYESCVSSTTYTSVSLSQCSGISVGARGICGGSSSSSSSSSSNVVPIIIRRG